MLLHGELSGRRIIRLDGEEIVNKKKFFDTGTTHVINVERNHVVKVCSKASGSSFKYICKLNGRSMDKYIQKYSTQLIRWELGDHIVEFDNSRGTVMIDGGNVQSDARFAECGTEHMFECDGKCCRIACRNIFGGDELKVAEEKDNELVRLSNDGKSVYELFVGDEIVSPKK